jgi:hypothetical protein
MRLSPCVLQARQAPYPGRPHSSKRTLFVLGMLPGCSTAHTGPGWDRTSVRMTSSVGPEYDIEDHSTSGCLMLTGAGARFDAAQRPFGISVVIQPVQPDR